MLTQALAGPYYLRMGRRSSKIEDFADENFEEIPERGPADYLTQAMQARVARIPAQYLKMSARELEELASPGVGMYRCRRQFWIEYEKAVSTNADHIPTRLIYEGIVSRQAFEEQVDHPEILAWMLSPMANYEKATAEALDFGLDRVRKEILTMPLFEEMGDGSQKFLKENAALLLRTIQFLDARVKGSPLQRIEQKNLQVNINQDSKGLTKEELTRELEEIRSRIDQTQRPQLQGPINVESSEGQNQTLPEETSTQSPGAGDRREADADERPGTSTGTGKPSRGAATKKEAVIVE